MLIASMTLPNPYRTVNPDSPAITARPTERDRPNSCSKTAPVPATMATKIPHRKKVITVFMSGPSLRQSAERLDRVEAKLNEHEEIILKKFS